VKLTAYIDGSCLGNPGEAGYGFILLDKNDSVIEEQGVYIGKATNNIAEYMALIGCIEAVEKYQPSELTIFSDSQLLVNQINGKYAIKKDHLRELYNRVVQKIEELSASVKIHHIPREKNNRADSLARTAVLKKEVVRK